MSPHLGTTVSPASPSLLTISFSQNEGMRRRITIIAVVIPGGRSNDIIAGGIQVNVDDKEIDAMHGEVASGATKGLAISTLLSAGMIAGLYQFSEGFRNLRPPLKGMPITRANSSTSSEKLRQKWSVILSRLAESQSRPSSCRSRLASPSERRRRC